MSESNASFVGVFSLRTPEQVAEMVTAVRNVVEQSAKIFYTLKDNPSSAVSLMANVNTVVRLSSEFPLLAKDPSVKARSTEIVQAMSSSRDKLSATFDAHTPHTAPSDNAAAVIAKEIGSILERTAELAEQMEIEQNKRVLATVKAAFDCVNIMKDTTNTIRLSEKTNYVTQTFATLQRVIDNRVEVTEDAETKQKLRKVGEILKKEGPVLVSSTTAVASAPNPTASAQQREAIKTLAAAIKDLIDMLQDPGALLAAKYNFEYKKLTDSLDALTAAVKQNASKSATENAKLIVDEVNKLQAGAGSANADDPSARDALNAASERLKNVTSRLLNATKASLQDPNNKEVAQKFDAAVDDMKAEAVQIAGLKEPKKSSSQLKSTLLQASKQLSDDMERLKNTVK